MSNKRSKLNQSKYIWIILFTLISLFLIMIVLLRGNDVILFNPKGWVASEQSRLMVTSTLIILSMGVPTLLILYFFAWRYRETGKKAVINHYPGNSRFLAFVFWLIPSIIVLMLASQTVPATFKLEPQKPIETVNKPLTVQVIALRWKWLFIYPEQGVATLNYVYIPVGIPVHFKLTADEAPMNSFWIPHLGGQLYAMTGHVNSLNLIANAPGDYEGGAAEINGPGFAGMRFVTHVGSKEDFYKWADETKQSANELNTVEYEKLLRPSQNHAAMFYRNADSEIFSTVINKYAGSHYGSLEHR